MEEGLFTMLTVNNVTKNFGNFIALEEISIDFENGLYGFLAPNGAGKTTLIKMLTTLLFPTKGDITYKGVDIIHLNEEYRNILGYLPQEFGYYKNYSPKQFLNYLAVLKGIDKKSISKKITELLKLVSLEDVADKKMKKFSGGMLQRIGIAQAMLNDPEILILDEPTAGLDPKERVRFRNLIYNLSKDRIVILSTHIVSDIETIANRVIMFKDHKLLCNDSPGEICNTLKEKVYETSEIDSIKSPYLLLTQRQENNRTLYRFACDDLPMGEVKKVAPNLEDVFLYIYRDEA